MEPVVYSCEVGRSVDHVIPLTVAVMDASLPRSLKHIISNADYYGPSLFLLGKCSKGLCKGTTNRKIRDFYESG